MNRFYIEGPVTAETVSVFEPKQLHHLKDVLRLKTGDEVTVFDARGNEFLCTISVLERKEATLIVRERKPSLPVRVKISIACAIPKQSRMDDIIDKLTQLGVDNIIPLVTERVIVKTEESKDSRLIRWNKIARSAAEQSGRNTLPLISPVVGIAEVLERASEFDLKLVPTLTGQSRSMRDVLAGSSPANILVIIGPEGDFTPQEIRSALASGFRAVSLGHTVLRVETAAIAVASYLRLAWM
jgi:16S rRNA (uracil1498-N3)-methyltransferase